VRVQQCFEKSDHVKISLDTDAREKHSSALGKLPRHTKGGVLLVQSLPQSFTAFVEVNVFHDAREGAMVINNNSSERILIVSVEECFNFTSTLRFEAAFNAVGGRGQSATTTAAVSTYAASVAVACTMQDPRKKRVKLCKK
jgi:hypothetical protein